MKSALSLALSLYLLLLTGSWRCWAQAEPQLTKPSPERQHLHYFVGTWQIEWETLPGPMTGAGGKVMVTDHNEILGDFFVVFHREGRGPRGSGKEIGILGYDPTRKIYTYENFSDDGDVGRATATISGDTWVVLAPATDNCQKVGDNFKERFTIKEVSPISYTFINEISVDGGPWTKIEQGKAAKK